MHSASNINATFIITIIKRNIFKGHNVINDISIIAAKMQSSLNKMSFEINFANINGCKYIQSYS